jgi:hypothetical protein
MTLLFNLDILRGTCNDIVVQFRYSKRYAMILLFSLDILKGKGRNESLTVPKISVTKLHDSFV